MLGYEKNGAHSHPGTLSLNLMKQVQASGDSDQVKFSALSVGVSPERVFPPLFTVLGIAAAMRTAFAAALYARCDRLITVFLFCVK